MSHECRLPWAEGVLEDTSGNLTNFMEVSSFEKLSVSFKFILTAFKTHHKGPSCSNLAPLAVALRLFTLGCLQYLGFF